MDRAEPVFWPAHAERPVINLDSVALYRVACSCRRADGRDLANGESVAAIGEHGLATPLANGVPACKRML